MFNIRPSVFSFALARLVVSVKLLRDSPALGVLEGCVDTALRTRLRTGSAER